MEAAGVLICGYGVRDAQAIKAFLDRTLDAYVIMVGASPKSDMKIIDILRRKPEDFFEEDETKILMFLGFSEVQTHMVLEGFPGDGGLKRPVFCTLTNQNQNLPLRELITRLLEERRRWSGEN